MRYTLFGETDLEVSRICFGTWQFGGDWGSNEEKDLVDAMRRTLDLVINFLDTAQAYGFGTSEQIVGKALEPEIKNRREEVVLATKGGLRGRSCLEFLFLTDRDCQCHPLREL